MAAAVRSWRGALFFVTIASGVLAAAQQCDDSCSRALNGRCDEPGFGRSCAAGTDCTDCGGRADDGPSPLPTSPPPPPRPVSRPAPLPTPEPEPSGLAGEGGGEGGGVEGAPLPATVLSQTTGLIVVIGFGAGFTMLTHVVTQLEAQKSGKTKMSSEQFNTGGRDVGIGLTAAVIVSQWTWAATLLQSSNVGWKYGISGPFWYASGATIQVLLFAILAIQVKRRCPVMHTYLEVILCETCPPLCVHSTGQVTNMLNLQCAGALGPTRFSCALHSSAIVSSLPCSCWGVPLRSSSSQA